MMAPSDLVAYLPDLLLLYAAFALAVASPGPSTMMIMSTAMKLGRIPALSLAMGVSAGSFTWGLLAAAGVSALIAAHASALQVIKLLGGAYLMFLAWRSARSALTRDAPQATDETLVREPLRRLMLRGYLMHLINPKAILGWTAIIAIGLPGQAPGVVLVAILAGCLVISLTLNCSYALVFSSAPMAAAYRRLRRWIDVTLAGFFAFAGVKLLSARF